MHLVMKAIVDHLWPKEPSPGSYFGLVQRFLCVVPHIEAVKRSACIEGVRMDLAVLKHIGQDGGHRYGNPGSGRRPGPGRALF